MIWDFIQPNQAAAMNSIASLLRVVVVLGCGADPQPVTQAEALAAIADVGGTVAETDDGLLAIRLNRAEITDGWLSNLRPLGNLQGLHLVLPSSVTDAELKHVGELTNLKFLSLSRAQVTDAGLAHLADLKSLESLYLSRTQ